MKNLRKALAWSGMLCVSVSSVPALGAENEPAALEDTSDQDIIVTATRRVADVQKIPVAVTVLSGDNLASRGVERLEDLTVVTPSLNITTNSSASTTNVRIRGIGTTGLNPGFEGAVGVFVDGVYRSRAAHALGALYDIARVEVLRGPQGTILGKNTSAGALALTSNQPTADWSGGAEATFGNRDHMRLEAFASGPLATGLGGRVAGFFEKNDGILSDVVRSTRYNDRHRGGVKAQLVWEPSDDLRFSLIADRLETNETCCGAVYRQVGPVAGILRALGAFQPGSLREADRKVAYNTAPSESLVDQGLALEIGAKLGMAKLTSITSYRHNRSMRSVDPDHSNADLLGALDEDERYATFTQEVRIAGISGRFDWLVGAFFADEGLRLRRNTLLGTHAGPFLGILGQLVGIPANPADYPAGQGQRERMRQDSESFALFTHNIWRPTDRVDVTLGLRYSREEKDASVILNDAALGAVRNDPFCSTTLARALLGAVCDNVSWAQRRNEDAWTGVASLGYRLSNAVYGYASYSRGYKAGGFNLDRQSVDLIGGVILDGAQFRPEKVDSFELGLKTAFADRRLSMNVAVFDTRVADFQQFNFNGIQFFIDNVDIRSRGAEVEVSGHVAEGTTASLGVTYAKTLYDEVPARFSASRGDRVQNAPIWQGSASIVADRPLTARLNWTGSLNVFVQGPTRLHATYDRPFFALVNAQIGLKTSGGLAVDIWARNLFDKQYDIAVFDSLLQSGSTSAYVGQPRSYGLRLSAGF